MNLRSKDSGPQGILGGRTIRPGPIKRRERRGIRTSEFDPGRDAVSKPAKYDRDYRLSPPPHELLEDAVAPSDRTGHNRVF